MSSNTETDNSTTAPTTVTENTERVLGLVKWFQGGFGFVTNFDTKEDVFAHHSCITTNVDCWKLLYPGEYVNFTVGTMDDGKSQAVNITGVQGGPLRCETLSILRQERDEYNKEHRQGDGARDGDTRRTRGHGGRGRSTRNTTDNTRQSRT